jgi:hypothetical protein
MTDNAKILTDSEKLNLILAKLSDMEARLAKLEARRNGGALPTPASVPDLDLWLDYRDAAKLMNRPQNYWSLQALPRDRALAAGWAQDAVVRSARACRGMG